jgi:hypothetical protein
MKNLQTIITTAIFLICATYMFSQGEDRTTIGYIPYKNIYGHEKKEKGVFFNYQSCEQSYIGINLTGFDIGAKRDKVFWKEYEPFLFVKIDYGTQVLIKVLKPESVEKREIETDCRARSIYNQSLFGPFPYNGKDVTITIQLYAFKVNDKLSNAINVLDDMTSLFPGQLNQIVEVSKVVSKSLDRILPNAERLVSIEKTWNAKKLSQEFEPPSQLREGFFIVHPIKQKIDYKHIKITDLSQLKYEENGNVSELFEKNFDYAVLEFEHYVSRPDIQTMPFYTEFAQCNQKAIGGDFNTMESMFLTVLNGLYSSEEFTDYDKMYYHNYLYNLLLVQAQNVDQNYKPRPTPILECTEVNGIKQQLAYMKMKQYLVDLGKIQPGESLSQRKLKSIITGLTLEQKQEVFDFLTGDIKIVDLKGEEDVNKAIDEYFKEILRN